jgi:hypothetical protein
MSSAPAPAKKMVVDPLEPAFDAAPWDDKLATEEEEEAMREVRAAEINGTGVFLPDADVAAEIAERVRLQR